MLTNIERRVLGHLPVWAKNEKAHVKAEGGPDISVRAYTLAGFTARLAEDPATVVAVRDGDTIRSLTQDECQRMLLHLQQRGFAVEDEGWRMTEAGYREITAEIETTADEIPDTVDVGLHPAHAKSSARY